MHHRQGRCLIASYICDGSYTVLHLAFYVGVRIKVQTNVAKLQPKVIVALLEQHDRPRISFYSKFHNSLFSHLFL